jgi:hypothetical protein
MEDTLLKDLHQLGLNETSYRALLLLPLVEVAWSDGRIQAAEAAAIEDLARKNGFFSTEAQALLQRWLKAPPTDTERELGMRTLVELARRRGGAGASLEVKTLQELFELSCQVASAAGGFFGLSSAISSAERASLDQIADILHIDDGNSWSELLADLQV